MKNIISALITGLILFGGHCLFAKTCYKKGDIIDLKESEVKEIDWTD